MQSCMIFANINQESAKIDGNVTTVTMVKQTDSGIALDLQCYCGA